LRNATPIGGESARNVAKSADIPPIGGKVKTPQGRIYGEPLPETVAKRGIPVGEKPLSFPQTVAKGDITAPELKQMIKNNPLSYKPINNPETLKYAQEIVEQNFDAAKTIIKEGESLSNATETVYGRGNCKKVTRCQTMG
jgi:hypothetical protein